MTPPPLPPEGFTYYGKGPLKNPSEAYNPDPDIVMWHPTYTKGGWDSNSGWTGMSEEAHYALRTGSEIARKNGIPTMPAKDHPPVPDGYTYLGLDDGSIDITDCEDHEVLISRPKRTEWHVGTVGGRNHPRWHIAAPNDSTLARLHRQKLMRDMLDHHNLWESKVREDYARRVHNTLAEEKKNPLDEARETIAEQDRIIAELEKKLKREAVSCGLLRAMLDLQEGRHRKTVEELKHHLTVAESEREQFREEIARIHKAVCVPKDQW